MNDINAERRRAVPEAWKSERERVREGRGTRDWTPEEQKQMLLYNNVKGYEGHHMKSVKAYPEHAGNPENIQFLKNSSEHKRGAHGGDTQCPTNGYYDHRTGRMHDFGNRDPQAPQTMTLSEPMTQLQKDIVRNEEQRRQAARQAQAEEKPQENDRAMDEPERRRGGRSR